MRMVQLSGNENSLNNMKKCILYVATLFLMSACSQEDGQSGQFDSLMPKSVRATFEQSQTRTYIDGSNRLHWTADDRISVFYGTTENIEYKFDGATGDVSGSCTAIGTATGSGTAISQHYAVYPYSAAHAVLSTGGISINLPSSQSYVANSFGLGANVMMAQSADDIFSFKNVCGYLKLPLYRENYKVKSITLTGNNGEKLAGAATVSFQGGLPVVTMSAAAGQSITLDCGSGVTIGSTSETATPFWFVVPPTTFTKGFTVTVVDTEDKEIKLTTNHSVTVSRNTVEYMKAKQVAKSIDPKVVFVNGVPKRVGAYTITVDEETGQVSKIERRKDNDDYQVATFTYPQDMTADPLNMILTIVRNNSTRTMTLTLDENLFVKAAVDEENESWSFEYSDEGYLTKFVCSYGGESSTGTYTYQEGDIVSSAKQDDSSGYSYTITNSTIENKGCIMLHSTTYCVDVEQYIYAYYAGLLGKATKHLPASVSGSESQSFNWTLNTHGFPTGLSEQNDWFDPITFEW